MRAGNASPGGRFAALRLVGSVTCGVGIVRHRLGRSCTLAVAGGNHSTLALSIAVGTLSAVAGTCSVTLLGVGLAGHIGIRRAILGRCALSALAIGLGGRGTASVCSSGISGTQGLVQVVERELDAAEINVAVGVVGCRGLLGHGGRRVVGRYREGELALNACGGQASIRLQNLHARKTNRNRVARGIYVLEHQTIIACIGCCSKLAVAVVDNRHRERNVLRLGGNATRQLMQAIDLFVCRIINGPCRPVVRRCLYGIAVFRHVGKGFGGVAELTEVDRAISFVACHKQVVAALSVLNRKAEFTLGKITASQALGSSNADFA